MIIENTNKDINVMVLADNGCAETLEIIAWDIDEDGPPTPITVRGRELDRVAVGWYGSVDGKNWVPGNAIYNGGI